MWPSQALVYKKVHFQGAQGPALGSTGVCVCVLLDDTEMPHKWQHKNIQTLNIMINKTRTFAQLEEHASYVSSSLILNELIRYLKSKKKSLKYISR